MPAVEAVVDGDQTLSKEATWAETQRPLRYWSWWLLVFVLVWLAVYVSIFPRPVALFQRNWPLIFVGLAGAMIGNATAVGGGLVFVPVMIFVYRLDPVMALKLALASQSIGMSSGAIGWLRRRAVPTGALLYAVPALLLGSAISTLLIRPSALLVKGVFGPVSILVGVLTLYLLNRHEGRNDLPPTAFWPLVGAALIGGLITGWVAIGEGEVVAAFLMLIYGLRSERSIGLGVVLLAINSIFLALLHGLVLGGIPWEMAIFTMLGCAFGGRLGPYLSQWVGPRRLKVVFAVVAIADGALFLFQSLRGGFH